MPTGHTIGETEGVAINSKKHLFVYTRSGNAGPARGSQAAELFEFDEKNNFVKEWGQNAYGFSFAHAVRVDKDDNVWVVDEGSNMVMKFNPQGLVTMVLGRKDEAIDYLEEFLEDGRTHRARTRPRSPAPAPAAAARSVVRPTSPSTLQGNIFVADGYDNSRVAKFTKDGDFVKSIGSRGTAPDQFNTPHAITSDAKGLIYVADRGNSRIQVYDSDLNRRRIISNVRAPWAVCITPPNAQGQQFLFSADAGGKIYKLRSRRQADRLVRHARQEGRPVLLGAPDALRQRERNLHRRSAELARSAHHAEDRAERRPPRGGKRDFRLSALGVRAAAGLLAAGDWRSRRRGSPAFRSARRIRASAPFPCAFAMSPIAHRPSPAESLRAFTSSPGPRNARRRSSSTSSARLNSRSRGGRPLT